jgi:hypothetical protein
MISPPLESMAKTAFPLFPVANSDDFVGVEIERGTAKQIHCHPVNESADLDVEIYLPELHRITVLLYSRQTHYAPSESIQWTINLLHS